MIKKDKKDRCICGHLKFAHSHWTGKCNDVFKKKCECKQFISEKKIAIDIKKENYKDGR
jgi:hypothetical protein